MDQGKIMKGIALVTLPAGVHVSPSRAAGPDHSCTVGCRSLPFPHRATVIPYSPLGRETPAESLAPVLRSPDPKRPMTLPARPPECSPETEPRTRKNDDHSMHIPGISSHRNVNNTIKWSGAALIHKRYWSGPALTPEYRELQSSL
jgi:hypothetical protein